MKESHLFNKAISFILLFLTASFANAAKSVYIPRGWVYNSSTKEYIEDGNTNLQWSFSRSKAKIALSFGKRDLAITQVMLLH